MVEAPTQHAVDSLDTPRACCFRCKASGISPAQVIYGAVICRSETVFAVVAPSKLSEQCRDFLLPPFGSPFLLVNLDNFVGCQTAKRITYVAIWSRFPCTRGSRAKGYEAAFTSLLADAFDLWVDSRRFILVIAQLLFFDGLQIPEADMAVSVSGG